MKFILPIMLIASLLAACTPLHTSVEAHSTIPADVSPRTVYIAPLSAQEASSLQWATNARSLAAAFSERQFTVVPTAEAARFTARFGLAIDGGQNVTRSYSIPQYGVTGYSGSTTTGYVYGNTYSANTTYTPTYGITGYQNGVTTQREYTRVAVVEVVDNSTRQRVFDGRGISVGGCSSLSQVAGPMFSSILTSFPAGHAGLVEKYLETDC